ncbi:MAG: hypothetical protein ACUVX8_02780 [Candidatus Zipacnadales bacterium]
MSALQLGPYRRVARRTPYMRVRRFLPKTARHLSPASIPPPPPIYFIPVLGGPEEGLVSWIPVSQPPPEPTAHDLQLIPRSVPLADDTPTKLERGLRGLLIRIFGWRRLLALDR